jgi:glycosyltransferase involved in cell wall biosynthesis
MTEKLVSIILPLYKSERYVVETVRSVLAQTHSRLELLIVDDGSPDDSAALCERIGDPRIQVFRRQNRGSCRSRNFGIARARGDFIAFIDHDDLWLPEKLERHVAHLERSPEVGISYGPSAFIDENGRRMGLYQVPKLHDVDARDILCRNPIGNGSAPLIRREVFEAIRFTADRGDGPEAFYFDDLCMGWEDVECWFRMAVTTRWKFEGIPDCLTLYRVNPEGLSAKVEAKQLSMEKGLERARLYAPDVIARHEAAAKAYHLRYLARRAVLNGDGRGAVRLAHRAVTGHPGILLEEPRRTLVTLAAAYALRVLPAAVFKRLESFAMARQGRSQAREIAESAEIPSPASSPPPAP